MRPIQNVYRRLIEAALGAGLRPAIEDCSVIHVAPQSLN